MATHQLLAEDQYLGAALARLLIDLGSEDAGGWRIAKRPSFATLFALGAERWDIEITEAAQAYAWVWSEHQVAVQQAPFFNGTFAGDDISAAKSIDDPDHLAPEIFGSLREKKRCGESKSAFLN
ncbi:MAG: urease accessory UreF family protein [Candidatus Binatia bacterium]